MNVVEIINKKSNKQTLTKAEIFYFVNGYLNGEIPDYQIASLLMAIKLNGFTDEETFNYTEALINSGKQLPLNNKLVDKHSSGGVGDKVSLILLPVLGAMGLEIFKLSGRGLAFTGGTIDKLESIKKFNLNLSLKQVLKQVDEIGVVIASQTSDLVPADGKIYALRDVTGTVDSPELIAASIISKKIASGAKNILIDLKIGTGAFISDIKSAKKLASLIKKISKHFNRDVFILISSMNQPLGKMLGNANEVYEAIEFLQQKNESEDLYKLIEKIACELYAKVYSVSFNEAQEKFNFSLTGGLAYQKFLEILEEQGSDEKYVSKTEEYWNPKVKTPIFTPKAGYIKYRDVKELGYILVDLKAGRKEKTDSINHNTGIKVNYKQGDKVAKGDKLFIVYSEKPLSKGLIKKLKETITISSTSIKNDKLILGEIRW